MPKATREIRLYPKQKSFIDSKALFRAFVGGIGSGKSWLLSYDMLRKSKPEHTYMIVSPTYSMLSDSILRTFLALARDLDLIDGARRSAPPEVQLKTGAEILFRSADDPEKLRGPNLAGVALDEASLMSREVYDIAIGRLRQHGRQGWLTAAFTPKGRQHWTYKVFGTKQPNTELFHATTDENPFLPEAFTLTVGQQYGSRKRRQELGGEFLDVEGALFQRDWFQIIDCGAVPPLAQLVRAWDLASTEQKNANDPDWTVGLLLGRDKAKVLYVLDVRRTRSSPQQVERLVRATAEADGRTVEIWMEQEPGSAGKFVAESFGKLLLGFRFNAERSTGSKVDRALPCAAAAENGLIKVARSGWNDAFLDEVESFPGGGHDDQCDALSLAFAKATTPRWKFDIYLGPTAPREQEQSAQMEYQMKENAWQEEGTREGEGVWTNIIRDDPVSRPTWPRASRFRR
jgi:predicted phage terminase large subunit-like protein